MATDIVPSMVSSPSQSQSTSPKPQPPLETVIENRIFVGGIPSHANVNELRTFLAEKFSKAEIKDIKIISDKTGVSKGYGFVTFETRDMAQAILNSSEYDNIVFKDRKLNISKAVKKLSTKLEHNNSGGGGGIIGSSGAAVSLGATAAFLPDAASAGAPVQYLLYRRPDSGLGQLLTALPFGYCTPVYLSGAPQALPLFSAAPGVNIGAAQIIAASAPATSTSTVCPTTAALQWPTPAASMEATSTTSAAAQLFGAASALQCLTTTAASGAGSTAAVLGQNGELIYYSLPALATAATNTAAMSSYNGGGHSDYGTGSDPSSSLLTDNGNDSPASSDNCASGLGIYGIIGSPVQSFKASFDCCGGGSGCSGSGFGSPQTLGYASHRSNGNCNGASAFNLVASHQQQQQQQQQPPKPQQQQQQAADCCSLLFGGINPFGEPRHDFNFLDHRV